MRFGIIGVGNIGSQVACFLKKKNIPTFGYDIDKQKVKEANIEYLDYLSIIKECDILVESANPFCASQLIEDLKDIPKDLVILSVGGLLKFKDKLNQLRCRIHVTGGAIYSTEIIQVAGRCDIKSIEVQISKKPSAFKGLIKNDIKQPLILYEGRAFEAIEKFPLNTNILATLLFFISFEDRLMKVKIIADPNLNYTIHKINIDSAAGELTITFKNIPSKNPSTSLVTIPSVINYIENTFLKGGKYR